MFEDSLVESTHRIHTRAQRYAAASLVLQATLAGIIVLLPYVYPDALPRKFLSVPLIAPPPAAAPIVEQHAVATPATRSELDTTFTAPSHIPNGINHIVDQAPPGAIPVNELGIAGSGPLNSGALGALASQPVVHAARPSGPMHVSSGVAEGQLIVPIQPRYPAIAVAAHVQGTVVVTAVIDTTGRIESLHVLSGPSLLVNAAVEAIRQARYRPWTLNGEPVEVETTIKVVFRLGN